MEMTGASRVSSGKPKSGAPAHANRHAYKHNPSSKLTKKILAMPINGLCPACEEQIEWRKRYRKYKPLTVAKKWYFTVSAGRPDFNNPCVVCSAGRRP